ncbi:MAG: succinyl-CoA synthetase subunit alpha [Nitrososphaerota archaeon]|jgi:hypothetical protein|nr:succinyl-CoA synthetase subunit alpha [Nitrososphaerota archaeon]MDG7041398.1 succinyl-CoA synthetase subunit alpha [Nitrososphaerota archaeon]MDG7043644.1 succinyl-CoA synthetase subunit alpha [Nitrososphaerota archaeon]
MKKEAESQYDYLMSIGNSLGEYAGLWIAIVDNKVVAQAEDGKKAYDEAKSRYPHKTPLITQVPRETVLLM